MAVKRGKVFPRRAPGIPAEFDDSILMAVKAMHAGNANDGQQKRLMQWIVRDLCETYALSYRPDQRATDFAEGRRSVGLQLEMMMNTTPEREKKSA